MPDTPTGGAQRISAAELGLGAVFHSTRDAVVVGEATTGQVVLWNRGAEATFGYDAGQASTLLLEDLVPLELRGRHRTGLARFADGGRGELLASGTPVELPALHADGRTIWVELALTELPMPSAADRYVMAIVRDVSHRKTLELDATQAHDALVATVDSLEQGVVLLTPDLEIRVYNEAARRILGFEANELAELVRQGLWVTYREDGSVMPPDERPLARALYRDEPSVGSLVRWRRRDASTVLLRISTRLLRKDGEVWGVVVAFVDATSDRALERARLDHIAELRVLNDSLAGEVALREHVLATVSHDMRNSLTAIRGFTRLLLDTGSDGRVDPGEALERIDRQASVLQTLTSDLLALAALQAGQLELHREEVDLDAFLRAAVADAGVDAEVQVDGRVVASADPIRLAQIVANLLTNAARYGRAPIRVVARELDGCAVIEVTDAGEGIAPEYVPMLFERFSLAHRSLGREERGTGLGLAIVRQLARAHGGEAWYEPAVPHGSRFVVRLPTEAADGHHPGAEGAAPPAAGDLGEILVVDDDHSFFESLRNELAGAGLSAALARSTSDALDAVRTRRVELVISAVSRPTVDGGDLVRRLRDDPSSASVPVILVGDAGATGDAAARAFAAGADDFVRKPIEPVELAARTRTAIANAGRRRDLTKLNESLHTASHTDPLTGVLNRRGLKAEMDRLAGPSHRARRPACALMIDVDRFKEINDLHGHDGGDHVLRAVADSITAQLRAGDAMGRWGGEEFLILLPDASLDAAAAVAERIRSTIESGGVDLATGTVRLTVSVGVACATQRTVMEAVELADHRVYAAKAAGRNVVVAD